MAAPSPWKARPSRRSPWEAVAEPVAEAVAEPVAEAVAEPVAEAVAEPAGGGRRRAVARPPPRPTSVPDAVIAEAPAARAAEPEPEPAPRAPPEPLTMAELLAEQDADIRSLKHGDVVEGTVVRIDPDEILVDFGGKSEGVVSNRELTAATRSRAELEIGDEVLVYVLQPESPEGHAVLSLRRAGLERKWRAMQERFDAGEIVEARVIDHNKGGLIVDCGVRGFVPISQIVDFPRRPRTSSLATLPRRSPRSSSRSSAARSG